MTIENAIQLALANGYDHFAALAQNDIAAAEARDDNTDVAEAEFDKYFALSRARIDEREAQRAGLKLLTTSQAARDAARAALVEAGLSTDIVVHTFGEAWEADGEVCLGGHEDGKVDGGDLRPRGLRGKDVEDLVAEYETAKRLVVSLPKGDELDAAKIRKSDAERLLKMRIVRAQGEGARPRDKAWLAAQDASDERDAAKARVEQAKADLAAANERVRAAWSAAFAAPVLPGEVIFVDDFCRKFRNRN